MGRGHKQKQGNWHGSYTNVASMTKTKHQSNQMPAIPVSLELVVPLPVDVPDASSDLGADVTDDELMPSGPPQTPAALRRLLLICLPRAKLLREQLRIVSSVRALVRKLSKNDDNTDWHKDLSCAVLLFMNMTMEASSSRYQLVSLLQSTLVTLHDVLPAAMLEAARVVEAVGHTIKQAIERARAVDAAHQSSGERHLAVAAWVDAALRIERTVSWNVTRDALVSSLGRVYVVEALLAACSTLDTAIPTQSLMQGGMVTELADMSLRVLDACFAFMASPDVLYTLQASDAEADSQSDRVRRVCGGADTPQLTKAVVQLATILRRWLSVTYLPKDVHLKAMMVLWSLHVHFATAAAAASSPQDASLAHHAALICLSQWLDALAGSATPPSSDVSLLPTGAEFSGLSVLAKIALVRVVITTVPVTLLLRPTQKVDGTVAPAILPRVYPVLKQACFSGGINQRLFVFHGLDSFTALISQASADGTIGPAEFDEWLGVQVADACDLVLANWDFPTRRVTILMPRLFGSLLSTCATMFPTDGAPKVAAVPDWRPVVFQQLLARTVGSEQVIYKGIFEALGMLIPPLGARNVLASHPSLVKDLVRMVQYTDVGPAVSSTLMQLLQGLSVDNTQGVEVVCAAVVDPLTSALTSPVATLRINIVQFFMPKLLGAFPALLLPLHQRLCGPGVGSEAGSRKQVAMSVDDDDDDAMERTVVLDPELMSRSDLMLLGEISMLACARKLGFDVCIVRDEDYDGNVSMPPAAVPAAAAVGVGEQSVDDSIQSPQAKRLCSNNNKTEANSTSTTTTEETTQTTTTTTMKKKSKKKNNKRKKKQPTVSLSVPVSHVTQGVQSADPELQLMTINFVVRNRKVSELPASVELAVLKHALVATLRVPTPDARGKLNTMFAKLFERIHTASAAAERSLKSLERFDSMHEEQQRTADELRESVAASRAFMLWTQELCLASIYPDAPFERTGTALELLNSTMLTLGKAEVAKYESKVREANEAACKAALEAGCWPAHLGAETGQSGDEPATEGPQTDSLIAPLLTPNTVIALVNMMLNSFDRARVLSQSILMQLPTPLPGFETRAGVQSLLRWALLLLASVKVRECDAGALLLELVRGKYVEKLGWVLDIPGSSAPNWAATKDQQSDTSSSSSSSSSPAHQVAARVRAAVQHARDAVYMSFAVAQAKQSTPSERAYCVGAIVVSESESTSEASGSGSGIPPSAQPAWLPCGQVRATGYSRECWGNTHAEEVALKKLGGYTTADDDAAAKGSEEGDDVDDAKGNAAQCTLYTTMEPCSTRLSGSRTCTSRIIAANVERVVIGVLEPNKFVAECQGAKTLREHGVRVEMLSGSSGSSDEADQTQQQQEALLEKECMAPNMFLFPGETLLDEPTRMKGLQDVLVAHVNVAHAQDVRRDLAQLYFLWQLVGLFEERLQGLRLTQELSDVSAALSKASMSRSYSSVGADEPTTVAIKRSLVMDVDTDNSGDEIQRLGGLDPARNGVRPVYVHGALLALGYTWQRTTESIRAAKDDPAILQAWRQLVDHTLGRVTHGLKLAMQVLGESDDDEEEEEGEGGVPGTGVAGAQRVSNLKDGAPTVAKNLKVDCRGHLIMETGDVAEGQGEQLVVVAGWLIVKEGSKLLGALVEHCPRASDLACETNGEDKGWVVSHAQLNAIGDLFLHMLLNAKHQGAISHARSSFQNICDVLLRDTSNGMARSFAHRDDTSASASQQDTTDTPEAQQEEAQTSVAAHLPSVWLTRLLSRLQECEQAFVLRRSVGFASCFMAIVRAEPSHCPRVLLARLRSQLFTLVRNGLDRPDAAAAGANDTLTTATPPTDWRVVVHCLNILKLLVSDSSLARQLQDSLPQALELSIFGFRSHVWSVRNSSMMVFGAVLDRMIGASRKNAELGHATHGISSAQLFNCHATLRPFLLRELSTAVQHSVESTTDGNDMHPSLYPLLLLLSHVREAGQALKPDQQGEGGEGEEVDNDDGDMVEAEATEAEEDGQGITNTSMAPFVELVLSCAGQRHFAARNMAANALASMLSPTSVPGALAHLSGALWQACTTDAGAADASAAGEPRLTHNLVHGLLLQCRGLISTLTTLQGLSHVVSLADSSAASSSSAAAEESVAALDSAPHLVLPREQVARIVHVAVRVAQHSHMAALVRTAAVDVLNGLDLFFGVMGSGDVTRLAESVKWALLNAARDHLCNADSKQPVVPGRDNQVLGDRLAASATRVVLASLAKEEEKSTTVLGSEAWDIAVGLVTLPQSNKIRCEPLKQWCRLLKRQTVELERQKATTVQPAEAAASQLKSALPPTQVMVDICTFFVSETIKDAHVAGESESAPNTPAEQQPWTVGEPYLDELCARLRLLRMVLRLRLLPDHSIVQASALVKALLALSARFSHASLRSVVIRLVGTVLATVPSTSSGDEDDNNTTDSWKVSCEEWSRTLRSSAAYSARVQVRVGAAKALQECSHVLLPRLDGASAAAATVAASNNPNAGVVSACARANAWIAAIVLLDDEDAEVRERARRAAQAALPFHILHGGAPVAERVRGAALAALASDAALVQVPEWQAFVLSHVVAESQASGLPAVNGATASVEKGGDGGNACDNNESSSSGGETLADVLGQLVGAGKDLGLLSTRVFEVEPDNLFAEPVLLSASVVEHAAAVLKRGDATNTGELRAGLVARAKGWIGDLCASLPLLVQAQLDAHRLGGATFHQAVHAPLVSMLYALCVLWDSGVVPEALATSESRLRGELLSGCARLRQSAVASVPRGGVDAWYAMEWSVERVLGRLIAYLDENNKESNALGVIGLAGVYSSATVESAVQ